MDPFHANLLLLQCQRLSLPPRPFDVLIRLLSGGADGRTAHTLFAHGHVLGASSIVLQLQLDQSPVVPLSSLLLPLLNAGGEQLPTDVLALARAGALAPELRELKLDLSPLESPLEPLKQFLAFLYGDPFALGGEQPAQLLLALLTANASSALPDPQMAPGCPSSSSAAASLLLGQLLPSPPPPPPLCLAAPSSSASVMANADGSAAAALPLYAAYLQLQSLLAAHLQQPPLMGLPPALTQPFGPLSSPPGTAAACPLLISAQQNIQQRPTGGGSALSPAEELQQPIAMITGGRRESSSSGCSMSNTGAGGGQSPPSQGGGGPMAELQQQHMLVPSNDKEGWCRNKKYIQIVKKGYRCLVCNKVYGRYNSVSYHVTIYHRNPPIRCEEEGCQFTTREARYIHFHKYYRHQIALPETIDLASRKCPLLGCKHVSKSPAMLDKHMQRHVADCLKEGIYACQMGDDGMERGQQCCQFRAGQQEAMYEHLLTAHSEKTAMEQEQPKVEAERKKSTPVAGGGPIRSTASRPVSASAPNTPPTSNARFHCEECGFRTRTMTALAQHKTQRHCSASASQQNNTMAVGTLTSSPSTASGLFLGGFFPATSFSLPGSPLTSSVFPAVSGSALFPQSFDQQSVQQLLGQLLAAQKMAAASALLSPQQQQPTIGAVETVRAEESKIF